MSKEFAIKLCITRIKKLCCEKQYDFVGRRKNLQALFDLGLTVEDVLEQLKGLSIEDYSGGPEADYDGSDGQVWKFIHPVMKTPVYIKVKFQSRPDGEVLKILSFHPEEKE